MSTFSVGRRRRRRSVGGFESPEGRRTITTNVKTSSRRNCSKRFDAVRIGADAVHWTTIRGRMKVKKKGNGLRLGTWLRVDASALQLCQREQCVIRPLVK